MALVNQIEQMKQQGMSENDIIRKLQDSGYSPLEINQAIEQSKIKTAVSQLNSDVVEKSQEENIPIGMQQSIMESFEQQPTIEQPQQEYPQYKQYEQYQSYYPAQQQEYPQYQTTTVENMAEITEQIIEEKIDEMRKKIMEINAFRILTERRIKNLDERLKKIESFIQELEIKILGKIGSYSEGLQDIKKEIELMQDSFGKVINPLLDNAKEVQEKKEVIKKKKRISLE